MIRNNNLSLEESKFTVDVNKEFLYNLIEKTANNFDTHKDFCFFLLKKYNLCKYNERNFGDNLKKWQRKKQRIPLDYFLVFGNILKYNKKLLFRNINSLHFEGSRVPLKCGSPLKLTKELASISELIKVEGCLTKRRCTFENTNTELTTLFKRRLIKFGVNKENIKERLHIKIQIPEDLSKEDFKILNLNRNIYTKNFYERILNLKKGIKKELIFSELNFNYNKYLRYRVFYKNKHFDVSIKVPIQDKIQTQSNFSDNRYQKITVSLRMDVHNITLTYILNNIFKIPYGKKSNKIFIPKIIKNSSLDILKQVISVVLAAESTIAINDRFISMTSLSRTYLKDFQEILLKFNITSKINRNNLTIHGFHNFQKILNNFDFIIKTKSHDLDLLIISNRMMQSPKGLSKVLYLQSLNKLGGIATLLEIRNNANRKGHSFRMYMKELLNKGYINLFENSWPRKYKISDSGKRFLKDNETYWLE